MALTPDDWQRLKTLFDDLIDQPVAERERALQDPQLPPALRAELASLLAHHEAAAVDEAPFLAGDAALRLAETHAGATAERPAVAPGQRLGAWQVLRRVGAGGMGEVFEARRADGSFEGRAAVKLLKRGMDSAAVLQRFAQERQTLARMNHPHIARLLDAGTADGGQPYVVLEYVDGAPLDQAAQGLPLKQRLALFLQLADAVSHAHRHLMVHRDLKPGNVLVDRDGQVKLLDFGIAKALDPLAAEDGTATLAGQRVFTPHYASPEQVRGEPVTTATDIYSLGVLLYQLLTGTRPTGRRATTPAEAARCVLEEEPTRPSRLSPSEAIDPAWLATRRTLEGDLDNILLKALEKAPERRYASVDALAADVRAHLAGLPVGAHAASPLYVLGKFLRRHRWAVLAGGLGALGLTTGLAAALLAERVAVALGSAALAGGLGLALFQGRQAAVARDQAQARLDDLRQLVRAVLFDYHDLIEALPGATPVRKRLVDDALRYLNKLSLAVPNDRSARRELGVAYRVIGLVQRNGFRRPHLGDTAGAARSYERAVALLEALVAEDGRDEASAYELALALSAQAGVLAEDGDHAAARPRFERAAALFTQHMAHDTPDHRHRLELARTHLRRADALVRHGDPRQALQAVQVARATLNDLAALSPGHAELPHVWVWVHGVTSSACRELGDWAGAWREERAAFDATMALLAKDPDNARFLEDTAGIAHRLISSAAMRGDVDEVRRWGHEACERLAALARRDPDDRTVRATYLDALIASGAEQVRVGAADAARQRLADVRPALGEALQRWHGEPDIQARAVVYEGALAWAHAGAGDHEAAQQGLQRADVLAAALQAGAGDLPVVQSVVLWARFQRVRLQVEQARREGAAAAERAAALAALDAIDVERAALMARRAWVPAPFTRALGELAALRSALQPAG